MKNDVAIVRGLAARHVNLETKVVNMRQQMSTKKAACSSDENALRHFGQSG
jgi:hypothetical protein